MSQPNSLSRRTLLEAAVTSSAALGLASCCPCERIADKAWTNALRLDGVNPSEQHTPASLRELMALVKKAEDAQETIRMTGSGHSFSDVAFSEGYLLNPTKLVRKLDLDKSQLKPEHRDDPTLVRVESGMTIRKLNSELWELGLSLSNLGGYDAQTIVGAAMTGTHGSGMKYGPIASQIESIELVTSNGRLLKLEPDVGITDPSNPTPLLSTLEGPVQATLVNSSEKFNAVAVSMGCMGVVYAVVLRAEPRFWLRETRARTTWGELSKPGGLLSRIVEGKKLDDGDGPDPDYYEVYFNPYPPTAGGDKNAHHCLVTKRYKLKVEPRPTAEERKRGRFGSEALLGATRLSDFGARLSESMNSHPESVPQVIDDSLNALVDKSYIDRSYNVFHLGPPNLVRAYGIEVGLDVTQTVRAVEHLFVTAARLAKEKKARHSSPPSLRFVASSDCQLAMMHGRRTTMLEMGMLVCADGADDLLKGYEEEFITQFKARPHWGLDLNVLKSREKLKELYPAASVDGWLKVYEDFNANGTFNGPFTDRLGISKKKSEALAAKK